MITVQGEESEMPQQGDRVRGTNEMSQTYEFSRSEPSHETVMLT